MLSLVAEFALRAEDYEACLRVCEMLMEECGKGGRSEEQRSFAVRSCLDLSKNNAYLDFEARSRLASFCVNFCADHELEEVLAHRIELTEKVPESIDPPLEETALNLKLPELANSTMSAAEQALADSTRALVSSQAASALTSAASAASTHAASALSTAASAASNAPAAVIPSAAVGISRSLATAVAAGTNVATERGTKAISSLFGSIGFGFASGTSEEEPIEADTR